MFVIVNNNNVILGPMRWNKFRFENVIQEECEFSCDLPARNDDNKVITVSESIKIMPILGTDTPEYNPKIQFLQGPFWTYTGTHAVYSYVPEYMNIDSVKEMLKEQVTSERWNKENAGVEVSINEQAYNFKSDRETRTILSNSVNLDSINWKFDRDTWLTMSGAQTQQVLESVLAHVQEAFNWELAKINEINACTSLEQLDAVVIKESN